MIEHQWISMRYKVKDRLGKVNCPVLVMSGGRDETTSIEF